jgi:5-methylthioadenosine/S-adenosylhomocysteine deaminase
VNSNIDVANLGERAPRKVDLLIVGCDIVALDPDNTTIRNGAIAVIGDKIAWIGKSSEASRIDPTEQLTVTDKIALPGLIDAHFHTAQQLLRGKIAAMARVRQLKNPIWKCYYIPFESILDPEDVYLSGLVAYSNMISVGTTCFAEAGGPHPDEMGRAALDTGIRGIIALSTIDQGVGYPPSMIMTRDEAIEGNLTLVHRWQAKGRVTASLALRQIMTCSPELIREIGRAATQTGVKVHTHLCEGTYEIDYALEHFGKRPAEFLAEIGVLNRHLHCAHSVLLSPNEIDLYVEHRPSACHCAFNNYALGSPQLMELWRRGVDIGLGTDGAAAWGSLDIFRVAHAARIGQQVIMGTPHHYRNAVSSEELLRIATNGGARALGLEHSIGSLEVGKKADILLLDSDHADQQPIYDPLFTAAATVIGRDVDSVIIDGKIVLKHRQNMLVDMSELRARLVERIPEIMRRFEEVM